MAAVAQWDRPSFGGNPYVTITAIDTSGGIATHRTTGETPFFVHASGSAITATGTSNPYEDLEFKWVLEVEDGVGGWESIATDNEGLTNPVSDTAVSAFEPTDSAPEFVCVIRDEHLVGAAQTDYRLTLTIRGKNGSTYTSATTTETFTVDPYSGTTYYFDPTSGSDANDGLSTGAPKQTWTALRGLFASNRQFLIKGGETMAADRRLEPTDSSTNVRFGSYDTGTATILADSPFGLGSGVFEDPGGDQDDFVWSNLIIDANSATDSIIRLAGAGSFTSFYFDKCTLRNGEGETVNIDADMTGFGLWDCVVSDTASLASGVYTNNCGWGFVWDLTISGFGDSDTFDHHLYWNVKEHSSFRYITFSTANLRRSCLNGNRKRNEDLTHRYVHVADNYFNCNSGCIGACGWSVIAGASAYNPTTQIIMERNAVTGASTNQAFGGLAWDGTYRNNVFWGNTQASIISEDEVDTHRIYDNLTYYTGAGGRPIIRLDYDNTEASLIRGNWIWDTRSSPECVGLDQTNHASVTCDNNHYYHPNGANAFQELSSDTTGTAVSFSTWQGYGFDASAIDGIEFGWIDPANGDFRVATANALAADADLDNRWQGDGNDDSTADLLDKAGALDDGAWSDAGAYSTAVFSEGNSFEHGAAARYITGTGDISDSGSLSVSGWAKLEAADNSGNYLVVGDRLTAGDNNGFMLRYNTTGNTWDVVQANAATEETITFADTTLDDNAFHHFCWTSDGSSAVMYVDGSQVDTDTPTLLPAPHPGSSWAIGTSPASPGTGTWNGELYDIRKYGRVLTAAEVAEEAAGPEPTNTNACTIQVQGGGDPTVGCTLEINAASTWNDRGNGTGSTAYQWLLDDIPISGATSSTFVTTSVGVHTLQETRSNDGGSDPDEVTVSSNSVTTTAAASGTNRNLLLLGVG